MQLGGVTVLRYPIIRNDPNKIMIHIQALAFLLFITRASVGNFNLRIKNGISTIP
jgi:hypothetical protein